MQQPQPSAPRPSFNFAALSTATKILLVAGLLFFIDTFLPWQRVCFGPVCASASAWGGDGGFLGVLAGLFALALVIWEAMQAMSVNLNMNVPANKISAGLAGGTVLFGLIKFIMALTNHPGFGAFIGIILLAAIAYGGYMKWQESTIGPTAPPGTAPPPAGGGGFTS